jgi:hypothetical protein
MEIGEMPKHKQKQSRYANLPVGREHPQNLKDYRERAQHTSRPDKAFFTTTLNPRSSDRNQLLVSDGLMPTAVDRLGWAAGSPAGAD